MSQIALPFDWPAKESEDAFIVGPSNQAAIRHLESFARWPVAATILTGPRKSGRSLLARIFAQRTGGGLFDDAERVEERALFHAWNAAQDSRRPLLIVADTPPPGWRPALPDLASRLAATPVVAIEDPDDALIARLLPRLLERRGLSIAPEVVGYLAPRLPRTHWELLEAVDTLDAAALAARRPITVPLARDALGLARGERAAG